MHDSTNRVKVKAGTYPLTIIFGEGEGIFYGGGNCLRHYAYS